MCYVHSYFFFSVFPKKKLHKSSRELRNVAAKKAGMLFLQRKRRANEIDLQFSRKFFDEEDRGEQSSARFFFIAAENKIASERLSAKSGARASA